MSLTVINCQSFYPFQLDHPMDMTSLNISLPKAMKEYIEAQVQEGCFSTPSEYMRALVREDQKRSQEKKLESLLLESLESGEPVEITPEFWEQRRQALLHRMQEQQS
jgi:antitoxin ParD1/3/4